MGDAAERLAHFTGRGNEAYMMMTAGHCAALDVRVDANLQVEYFCTIYDRRPKICRDLARGSPECEGERTIDRGAELFTEGNEEHEGAHRATDPFLTGDKPR